jgi:protein phosphatase
MWDRRDGVLVHCKAGYSRSAALVAAWLLSTGRATKVDEATEMIRTARPNVVIRPEIRDALQQWQRTIDGSPTAQSL